jgi:hypothetical protein
LFILTSTDGHLGCCHCLPPLSIPWGVLLMCRFLCPVSLGQHWGLTTLGYTDLQKVPSEDRRVKIWRMGQVGEKIQGRDRAFFSRPF